MNVNGLIVTRLRTVLCALLCLLLIAIAEATAFAGSWPPWAPITRGGGMSVPGGGNAAAVVIPSRKALGRYPVLTIHPGHPSCLSPCEWYERFDWKHDAVLLIVARVPSEFDIYSLARRGSTLRVTVGARSPDQAPFSPPLTLWMTVDVRKRLLGALLPRKVVVISNFPAAR